MKIQKWLILARISLLLLGLVGLFLCFFWFPQVTEASLKARSEAAGEAGVWGENGIFWIQMIVDWLSALPCFVILILGEKMIRLARTDNFFTKKSVSLLGCISRCLWIDASFFTAAQTFFVCLGWNRYFIAYLFLGILGLCLGIFGELAYAYLNRAVEIKEENDSIL